MEKDSPSRVWKFANCEFDERGRKLRVNHEPVEVETKPLDILLYLLLHRGEVVTHDELRRALWSGAKEPEDFPKPLFTAISKLRQALQDNKKEMVETVPKAGYRFAVKVEMELRASDPVNEFSFVAGDTVPGRPNWLLKDRLGTSPFNEVWKAEHRKTHEVRVFKMALEGAMLQALRREANLSRYFVEAAEDSSGFVRVLEFQGETVPFLLESAYGGRDLTKWAESLGGLHGIPLATRLDIMRQVSRIVGIAHGLGVLHKDLKPSNVLISEDGSGWFVKVADFGSAVMLDPSRLTGYGISGHGFSTQTGDAGRAGTWMYAAPEMKNKDAAPTIQADIYSLGVMLYQMVIGDFTQPLNLGWEAGVPDLTLQEDIALAAHGDASHRFESATTLSNRLASVPQRQAERDTRAAQLNQALEDRRKREKWEARKPWMIAALMLLLVGFCASSLLLYNVQQEKKNADRQTLTAQTTLHFLVDNIIGRSNPYKRTVSGGSVVQETFLDAIRQASLQIDKEFQNRIETAAYLHEAVASALDARSQYTEAADQFAIAAQQYRQAQGPLSQDAIIAEFRRENAWGRTRLPEYIGKALKQREKQQLLIAQIHNIKPELQAWQALAQTLSVILGSARPQDGLQALTAAIQRLQKEPSISPDLLINLKTRYCGIYLKLEDGRNAERAAREVISLDTRRFGPDTTALFQPEMALEEALYLQGNFRETLKQSEHDYRQFSEVLGPRDHLSLSALFMKAQANASLGLYDAAIKDEWTIYASAGSTPSGAFLRVNSLNTIAVFECHAGQLKIAEEHARQVIRESSPSATNQPAFANYAQLTIAESLLTDAEKAAPDASRRVLTQVGGILDHIDVPLVCRISGLSDFAGVFDLDKARLAILKGDLNAARTYFIKATPYIEKPVSELYYKALLGRLRAANKFL